MQTFVVELFFNFFGALCNGRIWNSYNVSKWCKVCTYTFDLKKTIGKKMKIIVSASCLKYEHRQQGREEVKG